MARGRSMLIHRRPLASTVSTFGVSGCSGGLVVTVPRAPRRRRGRFGMRTSRLVGHNLAPRRSIPLSTSISVSRYPAERHSWTHPEGWRDWPDEAPATPRKGKVPIPVRCGGGAPRASRHRTGGGFIPMSAQKLRCRECGTDYALEARYVCDRCFGPLEVSYAHKHPEDVSEI